MTDAAPQPCEFCGYELPLTKGACSHCRERLALRFTDVLNLLESDHVQDNLFRLGLFGKQNVERAITIIKKQ